MKKLLLSFSVTMVVTVIIFTACQSAKSSTATKMLSFNFEKGKGYDYEMILNMDQESGNEKRQMDMSNYYSMDVTGEEGDSKLVTITYDRFKMNTQIGGFNLEIDSDKPLPNVGGMGDKLKEANGVLAAIRGQKFQMKVNREGQILAITGFEEMANEIADSLGFEGEKKAEMMAAFKRQFSDSSVRDQFERLLYIFPNKEVKVGDSWTKVLALKGPLGGSYNSTYTVSEIEGDMVTLEEKSTISGQAEGMNMNGTSTGKMVIDSRSGLVVSGDLDVQMSSNQQGNPFVLKAKTKIRGKAR